MGTQQFTDENKVSRNSSDPVHIQLSHTKLKHHYSSSSLIKIQTQTIIKLSHTIYYKTNSQLYMRPTINQLYQTFCNVNNCTISVALFNNVSSLYKSQVSIQLYYRTPQNQSQFSQSNLSKFQCRMNSIFSYLNLAPQTPLQPSQVISE